MVKLETLLVKNDHRYRQLDSLRGIAALTVFIGHSIGAIVNLDLLNKVTPTPLSIFYNGYAAVMFFFVLSGFVLSLPYMNTEKPLNLIAFYIKRVFRIYPAFIVAILLSILLKQFLYDKHAMANSVLWFKQYWAWDWNAVNWKETLRTFLLIGPSFKTQLIDPAHLVLSSRDEDVYFIAGFHFNSLALWYRCQYRGVICALLHIL